MARALAEGEALLGSAFEERSEEINGLIGAHFAPKTLDAVAQEFAAAAAQSPHSTATNEAVAALASVVREAAARAVDDFKKVELWIALKAPPISDGNNFGADVQNFVSAEIKKMRHAADAMVDGASNYHWQRGLGIEKLASEANTETSKGKVEEKEDGKTTVKTSESTKETSKASPPIGDFVRYTVALDVKQYHASYSQLCSLRDYYLKAHVLLQKNMKRLLDPRGDGGGADRGVMSMF